MTLERRLREHFDAAAERLGEPPGALERVVRRGRRRRTTSRAAVGLGLVALLAAVPAVWDVLGEPAVELEPVAPPAAPTPRPTETPAPADPTEPGEPTAEPAPEPEAEPAPVALGELDAPVLAYGPSDDEALLRVDRDGEDVIHPEAVAVAMPDGQGGVLVQPAAQRVLDWLPDLDGGSPVRFAEADGTLLLRGLLGDGRALYSVRPDGDAPGEEDEEAFFAVALAEGAEPELLTAAPAYETAFVGPVVAVDGALVHASCHTHCTLWEGLPEASDDGEPLYYGGGTEAGPSAAIGGLTATSDGRVLGFVEADPTLPDEYDDGGPELVLLDGASFSELARIPLPPAAGEAFGSPTVSLSADGQRVLVALGSTDAHGFSVPTTPYLVDDALTDTPAVRRVDYQGVVRWANP